MVSAWVALQVVLVGCPGAEAPRPAVSRATQTATQTPHPAALLDLNDAATEELARLPGVGPKKAAAIVELRQRKRFVRVTELLQVRGIGRATLARLRAQVTVRPSSGAGGLVGSHDSTQPSRAELNLTSP